MNHKYFLGLIATSILVLSSYSHAAVTVSSKGIIAKSGTVFTSSVSEDGSNYKATLKVGANNELSFKASMQVDDADVGKQADILLVIGVEPKAPFDGGVDTKYSAYTSKGKIVSVNLYASPDVWMAELTEPYRPNVKLGGVVTFNSLGKYRFDKAAMYYVFIGYRLVDDGTVVYNEQPIIVDATQTKTTSTTPDTTAPTNTAAGDATPTVTEKPTTTPTTTPTTGGEPTAYAGMIAAHNAWRKKVGVPDLTWSKTLATVAQTWANSLKSNQNCAMVHSANPKYGENLYWSSGFTATTQQVVDAWGNEVKDYTYATNKCAAGKMCGHYTQVVWKDTTEVGCGKATCGAQQIWVCNYNPPGNWIGQKPY
ncbi:MAG: pathogenesis-related family 1 protein [Thiotrichaceae bacterium]